jgi:hypothetical protein
MMKSWKVIVKYFSNNEKRQVVINLKSETRKSVEKDVKDQIYKDFGNQIEYEVVSIYEL